MKKIILIITFSLFTKVNYCQIANIYSIKNFSSNIECNLYLFKSGVYYIELSELATLDIIDSFIISYGYYSQEKGKIILTDKILCFEIILTNDKDGFSVEKGFACLKNKKFSKCESIFKKEPSFINEKNELTKIETFRNDYKNNNKRNFTLNTGLYCVSHCIYSLNLGNNYKFKINYKGILISEGKWERSKNEIKLFDNLLNYSFFALIGEKKIISKLLPGEYRGIELFFNDDSIPR